MFTITLAKDCDLDTIRSLAYASWPSTYGEILSTEQLFWMLEKFYSEESLQKNIAENHNFYIYYENQKPLGFVSVEHQFKKSKTTRLHKIYLNPQAQGKGIGAFLIDFVKKKATENNDNVISLNVNKFNKAVSFYKKMDFRIVASEVIELGNGFVMDDYKMEKYV